MNIFRILVAAATAGLITVGSMQAQTPGGFQTQGLVLNDQGTPGDINYIGLYAPATNLLTANYSLVLPSTAPSVGQLLSISSIAGISYSTSWVTGLTLTTGVQYDVLVPQVTALNTGLNRLFDISYAPSLNLTSALGARITSTSGGLLGSDATGLTLAATAVGTGTATGLNVSASGGTNNYALIAPSGNVGIGTSTPARRLEVSGTAGTANVRLGSASGANTATALAATDGLIIGDNNGDLTKRDASVLVTPLSGSFVQYNSAAAQNSSITRTNNLFNLAYAAGANDANAAGATITSAGGATNRSATGVTVSATATGTGVSTGLSVSASGGASNYALVAPSGSVGIGTSTPASGRLLEVTGTAGTANLRLGSVSGADLTTVMAATDGLMVADNNGDVTKRDPSVLVTPLAGSFVRYDAAAAQNNSMTRTNNLFNLAYNGSAADANAAGAVIASTGGATNRSATGLAVTATASGTGVSTGLSLSASGGTSNYALVAPSGSVGIGTSTPASGRLLEVTGTAGTANVRLGSVSGADLMTALGESDGLMVADNNGDVTKRDPSVLVTPLAGSFVRYDAATAQSGSLTRTNSLFNLAYSSGATSASALGATITSSAGSTGNFNATGLTVASTATGTGAATGQSVTATAAATGTATALSLSATGGTNNYGLVVPNGRVGIGTSTPTSGRLLEVTGTAGTANVRLGSVSGADLMTAMAATDGLMVADNNGDVTKRDPSVLVTPLAGSFVRYDVAAAQNNSMTRTDNLFNLAYNGSAADANAAGAVITSAGGATNRSATGLAVTATATGTGVSTGLSLSASGGTSNYALVVPSGSVGIGTSTPTSGRLLEVTGTAGTANIRLGSVSGADLMTAMAATDGLMVADNSGDVTKRDPSVLVTPLAGSFVRYDVSTPQNGSTTRTHNLLNLAYGGGANDANAAGAVITSAAGATNRSATGLTVATTATGTGVSTGLSLSASGGTSNYALVVPSGSVGIGTSTPASGRLLHVTGTAGTANVRMGALSGSNITTAMAATDGIIIGDNNGDLTKRSVSTVLGTTAWLTTANTGLTNGTNNFMGTTDATPIRFVTNGTSHERMRITETGNVGINAPAPISILQLRSEASDDANDVIAFAYNSTAQTDGAEFVTGRARGTIASPAVLQIGDDLGGVKFRGYDGSSFIEPARIEVIIDKTPTVGNLSAYIELQTNGGVVHVSSDANLGVRVAPNVGVDIDGGLAMRPGTGTNITGDNTQVTVGNRSFLRITSNDPPTGRTITLTNGLQSGQLLTIRYTGSSGDGIELRDSGTLQLTGHAELQNGDTITLIWDDSNWYELSRSNN